MQETDVKLDAEQLSARWGGKPTVGTLTQWRYLGKGPGYIKVGRRVLYPLASVLEYEAANTIACPGV